MAIEEARLRAVDGYYKMITDIRTTLAAYRAAEYRLAELHGLNLRIAELDKHIFAYKLRLSLSLARVSGETFRTNANIMNTRVKPFWFSILNEGYYPSSEAAKAEAELLNLTEAA